MLQVNGFRGDRRGIRLIEGKSYQKTNVVSVATAHRDSEVDMLDRGVIKVKTESRTGWLCDFCCETSAADGERRTQEKDLGTCVGRPNERCTLNLVHWRLTRG